MNLEIKSVNEVDRMAYETRVSQMTCQFRRYKVDYEKAKLAIDTLSPTQAFDSIISPEDDYVRQ